MYYVLCFFFFFFALFPPQNGLVGRNPINTEKNGSSALDGRLGSHSDFFRCPYGRPASYGWCQMVPGALASNQNLRSSSKYVSLPSAPGTEQIRRVFRNVVHLFTRLRWPPMSFWVKTKESRFKPCWISHLCQSGRCLLSPCRAGRCASRWTSPAPGPPPPSHGRRKTPCRHRGFRSPEPRRSQQTLVLEGKGSVSASDFRCNDCDCVIGYMKSCTDRSASASRAARCGWTDASPCFWRWWNLAPSGLWPHPHTAHHLGDALKWWRG